MIIINFDFTTRNELSYLEGKAKGDNFETNCLDFFSFDTECDDVLVMKKNGSFISRNRLLAKEYNFHKEIRTAHNLHKMLVAGTFDHLFK